MPGANAFPFPTEALGNFDDQGPEEERHVQDGCGGRKQRSGATLNLTKASREDDRFEVERGRGEAFARAKRAKTERPLLFTRMSVLRSGLVGAGAVLLLAGCTTPISRPLLPSSPPLVPAEQAPAPPAKEQGPSPSDAPRPVSKDKKAVPVGAPTNASTQEQADAAALATGEFAILVESQPSGAMIVVNGIPVGRTPRKIILPGTSQGFSRGTVSIKARFVASSSTEQSATIEEEFTPLDRLPVSLLFTPEKAQRRW